MSPYASDTTVSVGRSREQIEVLLERAGAHELAVGWEKDRRAVIGFTIGTTRCRLEVKVPARDDRKITHGKSGRRKTDGQAEAAWQQESRRRWRALLLVIKAKLEAIDSGISTLEREFLADMVLPNGRTMGEWAEEYIPQIADKMPPLLPEGKRK